MRRIVAEMIVLTLLSFPAADLRAGSAVPDDFPRFVVPGHEQQMKSLRDLFWLHYVPGGPLATLWDEWMSSPTLWPALESTGAMHTIRDRWRKALLGRIIDPEGYVATHQHASIAHQLGWPFPFWKQGGPGTWGWHFSLHGTPKGWHGTKEKTQEGWTLENGEDKGIENHAWNIRLTGPNASVEAPPMAIDALQSPFIQLRWRAKGLGNAQPYLEWTTAKSPNYSTERRMYFAPIDTDDFVYTMIPVFKHPKWAGTITGLRVHFGNPKAEGYIGIQALFTQYDTRHNINNQNFVRGSCRYFWWTRDLNFLRDNIQRMRLAIHYLMTEMHAREKGCILTTFVGHCGRSGIERTPDGKKKFLYGVGIGNNYWDLLPMGHMDAYATIHYYDALNHMMRLEREIADHPGWDVPGGPLRFDADDLARHAKEVKKTGGQLFWNPETRRFTTGIDVNGKSHDYGFTFINLEAVYYGFATEQQARDILSWVAGERIVPGDTSQKEDIYRWRFGPRSTTKRNLEYYGWFWASPESISWGGQVQDGGAVLGFSYHDMMARLATRGPNDAWRRLQEVIRWFDEVQAAGGYRKYYEGGKRGTTLQGGGTAGGLGLDHEFFESILVPQVILDGFLGFRPTADGFVLRPRLPGSWPSLTVNSIHLHNLILRITVEPDAITVRKTGRPTEPTRIILPPGPWTLQYLDDAGKLLRQEKAPQKGNNAEISVQWAGANRIRLEKRLP